MTRLRCALGGRVWLRTGLPWGRRKKTWTQGSYYRTEGKTKESTNGELHHTLDKVVNIHLYLISWTPRAQNRYISLRRTDTAVALNRPWRKYPFDPSIDTDSMNGSVLAERTYGIAGSSLFVCFPFKIRMIYVILVPLAAALIRVLIPRA